MIGTEAVVGFGHALREASLSASTGSLIAFADALEAVGIKHRSRVRSAARATLLDRHEHEALFDACFAAFFDGRMNQGDDEPGLGADESAGDSAEAVADGLEGPPPADGKDAGPSIRVRFSSIETLRTKDFANCTPRELDEIHRAMRAMRLVGTRRRGHRLTPARRGVPDVRHTMRSALRNAGEPVRLERRGPSSRRRRVVLLLDVSGSMEPYATALLHFAHAAVAARSRVEVFTLGTRLTRLTRDLAGHDPDAALRGAVAAVPDWGGGTRIGEALRVFNGTWGARGMARGAIVVVLSDGWDRGAPELIAAEMERLSRVARRVVWANPLHASAGYAPLASGMAAALPYVDDLVDGHALASVEHLAALVAAPS